MKSNSSGFIAGEKAAEQRAAVAHSASYGKMCHCIFQAPAGAKENHETKAHFFRPIRGLNCFADIVPTVVTVGYYHALLRSFVLEKISSVGFNFDLWRIHSPIC
ncbi:MAG TPA: hypothetical protein VE344_08430 [Methylomirabilota bacterium]|nr:hypothetical protein [Methylomirabilota bacterium]